MRRQIIGGGARRRCQKQPVAGQFVEPRLSVHHDLQLRGLVGLAKKVNLVDGKRGELIAVDVRCAHLERMKCVLVGIGDALMQVLGAVAVHQEPDRAAIHPVDELAGIHRPVQRVQHEAVAAQRNDHVGLVRIMIPIDGPEILGRLLRFLRGDAMKARELNLRAMNSVRLSLRGRGASACFHINLGGRRCRRHGRFFWHGLGANASEKLGEAAFLLYTGGEYGNSQR